MQEGQIRQTNQTQFKLYQEESQGSFNILQTQHAQATYSLHEIERVIDDNLQYYLHNDQEVGHTSIEPVTIKNSLDGLINKMILKIETKIQKSFHFKEANSIAIIESKKKSQLTQYEKQHRTKNSGEKAYDQIKLVQDQNERLKRQLFQLKVNNKQLKNTILDLSKAYQESKTYYQQQIHEIKAKFIKLEKQPSQTTLKAQQHIIPNLNIPRKQNVSVSSILELNRTAKNNYLGVEPDLMVSLRSNEVKSAQSGSFSDYRSKQEFDNLENQVQILSRQNSRIKQHLHQLSTKLRSQTKKYDQICKEFLAVKDQRDKLDEANKRKKVMIQQLMSRIEKKYHI